MSRLTTTPNLLNRQLSVPLRSVAPTIPRWTEAIPGFQRVVDRLGMTEFRRRLFHMTPAFLPIGLPYIPHRDVWGPPLLGILAVSMVMAIAVAIRLGHLLKRRSDEDWASAVVGYMVPVFAGLILFPGRAELGLMTLQIIALGDGSATLGGILLGGKKLPWNKKKTFSGIFCFAIVGSIAATYSYWGEANPVVPVGTAFFICSVAALCAGIVESLPIKSNDNLRVGTTALLVGLAMSSMLG